MNASTTLRGVHSDQLDATPRDSKQVVTNLIFKLAFTVAPEAIIKFMYGSSVLVVLGLGEK